MKTKITWKMFREYYLYHIAIETLATAFGVHRNTLTNWEKVGKVPDNETASVIMRLANLLHDGFVLSYANSGAPNLGPAVVLNEILEMFTYIEEARKMKSEEDVNTGRCGLIIETMKLARGDLNQRLGFKFPISDEYTEKDLTKLTRPVRPNEYVMF